MPFVFLKTIKKDNVIKHSIPALLMASFLTACSTSPVTTSDAPTPSGITNVPYKDVIALPFSEFDEAIEYGSDPLQRIYVWKARGKPQHSLVFIHGGCWLNAFDYTHGQALFTALAKAGVNVYALEYRRTGDDGGGWPGSFNDVLAGTSKVLALTQTQRPSVPVSLAGHSAGGHLALLTGQAMPSAFAKVIGLAAITQPAIYAKGTNSCETATPQFFNGTPEEMPEAYKSATPSIENVQSPVVLLQGTADNIVATEQSSLSGATTMLIPGAGHFDFLHADSLAYYTLLDLLKNG